MGRKKIKVLRLPVLCVCTKDCAYHGYRNEGERKRLPADAFEDDFVKAHFKPLDDSAEIDQGRSDDVGGEQNEQEDPEDGED